MTLIKLCGMMSLEDIDNANALKPDFVGFIRAPKSRRCITAAMAGEFRKRLDPSIAAVGVYVDEKIDVVVDDISEGRIEIIQLHGHEDDAYIAELRGALDDAGHHGTTIMKAFRIDTVADIKAANETSADYCLVDSGNGGTGTIFDWKLLKGMTRPYFLAGGLDPENVGEALSELEPYGVDVSSGIETNGKKDAIKMARFVDAVRKRR